MVRNYLHSNFSFGFEVKWTNEGMHKGMCNGKRERYKINQHEGQFFAFQQRERERDRER